MRIISTLFSTLCTALGALCAGLAFVCVANPHRPQLYLIDIFTVPILAATLILSILFVLFRQGRAASLGILATALLVIAIWPQMHPSQGSADPRAAPIRMIWANLWVHNGAPQKLLPWIAAKNADVVALVEVNSLERADMIEKLHAVYPYMVVHYDMIIAAKYPISRANADHDGLSLVTLSLKTPHGQIYLATAHMTRPWPYTAAEDQPDQFDRLANALQPLPPSRVVIAGDFNTTPSAVQLHDFAQSLELHAAPALAGTWKSTIPPFARVAIDNVLASSDLNLSHREVGPNDGSDHLPVYVEIRPVKSN